MFGTVSSGDQLKKRGGKDMKAPLIIALAFLITLISGFSSPSQDRDRIFQTSTIKARGKEAN